MKNAPVLIADDDDNILTALRLLLKNAGYATVSARSPDEVLAALSSGSFGMLLLDLNFHQDTTSGSEGLALLPRVRAAAPDMPVVVMTGWSTIEVAVEAMRRGASDFIEKPWENARLLSIVRALAGSDDGRRGTARPREETRPLAGTERSEWVVASPAMQQVMDTIAQIADADINILLTGENGTGKSQLAAVIHERSSRRHKPFVSLNMGAIPDGLFESELYGHTKGAFTDARNDRVGRFEAAEGGTLFMDEIGNLPPIQQNKLLQVLESGEFQKLGSSQNRRADVRIIAATNADIRAMVNNGAFRQDLLYRLNGIEIRIPPLRARTSEIRPLAEMYLRRYTARYNRKIEGFTTAAMETLTAYPWPGNVRELDHVIERATLLAREARLDVGDLGLHLTEGAAAPISAQTWEELTLEDAEKQLLLLALRRHTGRVSAAARSLGISRSAFYRRLEKHGY
jgi:DNA-binding NtrC family response regulator